MFQSTHEYRQNNLQHFQNTLDLLFEPTMPALKGQLLKWIGNKQKFASELITYFPKDFGAYYEPFLGSGAVLAALAPKKSFASDIFKPVIEIWQQLQIDVVTVIKWYQERYALIDIIGKKEAYARVLASYNAKPNGADLLFLSRVCYGGVVRFRKADGYMSTPCGPHKPMPPKNFEERARIWAARTAGTTFIHSDFAKILETAEAGDLAYLDPPYVDCQSIIYGAQAFSLPRLFETISNCKARGVRVALSIDGTKKSGNKEVKIPMPEGLFEREIFVSLGSSMLKRFQLADQNGNEHHVTDRLLLTY
jgi:DNA adenine methylase